MKIEEDQLTKLNDLTALCTIFEPGGAEFERLAHRDFASMTEERRMDIGEKVSNHMEMNLSVLHGIAHADKNAGIDTIEEALSLQMDTEVIPDRLVTMEDEVELGNVSRSAGDVIELMKDYYDLSEFRTINLQDLGIPLDMDMCHIAKATVKDAESLVEKLLLLEVNSFDHRLLNPDGLPVINLGDLMIAKNYGYVTGDNFDFTRLDNYNYRWCKMMGIDVNPLNPYLDSSLLKGGYKNELAYVSVSIAFIGSLVVEVINAITYGIQLLRLVGYPYDAVNQALLKLGATYQFTDNESIETYLTNIEYLQEELDGDK